MKTKTSIISVIASAILFTLLFYKHPVGLNLLLFELVYLTWVVAVSRLNLRNKNMATAFAGLILTAVFTVFTYSTFVYVINILTLMIFTGMLIHQNTKSYVNAFLFSLTNIWISQIRFFSLPAGSNSGQKHDTKSLHRLLKYAIPVIIIFIFIVLYRNSNPVFNKMIVGFENGVSDFFDFVYRNLNFLLIGTFLLGLLVSIYLLLPGSNKAILGIEDNATDLLKRQKSRFFRIFKTTGLRNEYKAGVFLLLALNMLILIVNVIDIYWVWFNFTWNGQYLKQFVHQGTYLLILSILVSISIVLYFFRHNINYYSKNTFLKHLSYIWLAQNAGLAVSVGIRNFWYIYYYALAYKRIGVIIFLILTLVGLYTVYIKVREKRTAFYLYRVNAYAMYIVLVVASIINWDVIIARYNFSQASRSYLHFDFMANLSDKSLPFIDHSLAEMQRYDSTNKTNFPNEVAVYMSPTTYCTAIEQRKVEFKKRWEAKSFLSWNYPENKAYYKLFKHKPTL